MGSNWQAEGQLQAARTRLVSQFPDIRFGRQMVTEAIGRGYLSPFLNQMARFTTFLPSDEVHNLLKQMEFDLGRRPADKSCGIVKMDADLLSYDEDILKPEDFKRDYIREELERFPEFRI
jgi:2-amino-4-hydroxy-6-hydroxymethyldihydropteridine diphosphokinase